MNTLLVVCLIVGMCMGLCGLLEECYFIKAVSQEQHDLKDFYANSTERAWGCGLVCIIVVSLYIQFVLNNNKVWDILVAYTVFCLFVRLVTMMITAVITSVRSFKNKEYERLENVR